MGRHETIKKVLLHAFVPLNALTDNQLERLLGSQQLHYFSSGEQIFDDSSRPARTFYLLDGCVLLSGKGSEVAIRAGDKLACHPLDGDHRTPRRAVAKEDVKLISFDSEQLDSLLAWDQSADYATLDINSNQAYCNDREWMVRLLRSRFFRRVPPSNILRVFERMQAETHSAGEAIIQQHQAASCCYIIKQGVCEVAVRSQGEARPTAVAMLEKGDWFGEEALLSGGARNATVRMVTDGVLMRLGSDDFDALLREPIVRMIGADAACTLLTKGGSWLDVRTADEFAASHLDGAVNMPLNVLRLKSRLLQRHQPYIACCDTGRRSATAAFLLNAAGLDVFVLEGGLNRQGGALIHRFAQKD